MSSIFLKVCSNIRFLYFNSFVSHSVSVERWQNSSSFGFLVWVMCVGKNQMCLNVCWLSLHGPQRFAAIRRQGFLPLNFLRRTELQIYHFPVLRSTKPLLAYRCCYGLWLFDFKFCKFVIGTSSALGGFLQYALFYQVFYVT